MRLSLVSESASESESLAVIVCRRYDGGRRDEDEDEDETCCPSLT